MASAADQIISLYERNARAWDDERSRSLFERPWLQLFSELMPPAGSVLDIGCGSGEPIAGFFVRQGYRLHGVDSSPTMIAYCKDRFPNDTWDVADMRSVSLGRSFDGILAWDSFFHLCQDDQRRMFPIFRQHASPNAALMFTSGPRDGVAMGSYGSEPLYHASLAPEEYRALFDQQGFELIANVFEDPTIGGHTVWLARLK
jgi:SAM-dependent methyltransferase